MGAKGSGLGVWGLWFGVRSHSPSHKSPMSLQDGESIADQFLPIVLNSRLPCLSYTVTVTQALAKRMHLIVEGSSRWALRI